ncbi:S-layer homology domain-containing protein [Sporosarcina sp. FSL K6-3457]|uniref:S-layer homology domain-containing protein n=1 Tax=Sporosarcina sp. FSL K6-3457 TaxID=2978204 RepID=UPI0030FA4B57
MNYIKSTLRHLFVAVLLLQLIVFPLNNASADTSPALAIDYLALGDSLAAGIDPNGELGNGYPDYLAESIKAQGVLSSYNKGFSYPGYTTTNVLEDLKANVTKDVYGDGYPEKTAQLHSSIASAEIITLSVGANDALASLNINPDTGAITADPLQLVATIQKIGANTKEILSHIQQLNPDAKVYVMGYYNPFPHAAPDIQPTLTQLLRSLNGAIQKGMEGTDAIFVPTADIIAQDYAAHLPNPKNIHLSEVGYQKVAEQFWATLQTTYPWTATTPITLPATPTLFTDIAEHPAKEQIEKAVAAGLVSGYADGTFKPDNHLTRAQAASILVRALGLKTDEVAPFKDISSYAAGTQADINAAYTFGLVKGNEGNFSPSNQVTHAQLALMIERAYTLTTGVKYKASNKAPFSDFGSYNEDTVNAISMLYEQGLTTGEDGKFMPSNPTTRAYAAVILIGFMEKVQETK